MTLRMTPSICGDAKNKLFNKLAFYPKSWSTRAPMMSDWSNGGLITFKEYQIGLSAAHNYSSILLPRELSFRLPPQLQVQLLSASTAQQPDASSATAAFLRGPATPQRWTSLSSQLIGKTTVLFVYSGDLWQVGEDAGESAHRQNESSIFKNSAAQSVVDWIGRMDDMERTRASSKQTSSSTSALSAHHSSGFGLPDTSGVAEQHHGVVSDGSPPLSLSLTSTSFFPQLSGALSASSSDGGQRLFAVNSETHKNCNADDGSTKCSSSSQFAMLRQLQSESSKTPIATRATSDAVEAFSTVRDKDRRFTDTNSLPPTCATFWENPLKGVDYVFLGVKKAGNPLTRWLGLRSIQSSPTLAAFGRVYGYSGRYTEEMRKVLLVNRPSELPVILLIDWLGYVRWHAVGTVTTEAAKLLVRCAKMAVAEKPDVPGYTETNNCTTATPQYCS